MQRVSTTYDFSKWAVALIILTGGLMLGGCDRRQQSAPPPVPEVAVITVTTRPVALTTELPGRTSPYRVAEIRPQVNGLIQKRLFTEGTDVKTGEVLYRIDPAPFQANLDNARAALGKAQANLPAIRARVDRYQELLTEKAVSQQEYDDAEAALKQTEAEIRFAHAAVETARINLNYTRITAPISGRIGRSNITDGALVGAYQAMALTTIQQLDPIYVDVTQSTTDLLRLRRNLESGRLQQKAGGQKKVRILLEDGTSYAQEGTLQFRDVSVDPTTGSVILRAIVPNPDGFLLPGMFVRALLQEGVSEKAILLPQQAVSRDPKGNPLVLIVDDENKVGQRILTIDRAVGDQWLVTSGIGVGERVIIEGIQKVRPGAVVKTVPFEAAPPKAAVVEGNNAQAVSEVRNGGA